MKRAISLILALVLCLSLCACGKESKTPDRDLSNIFRKIDFSMTMNDVIDTENATLTEIKDNIITFKGFVDGYPGEIVYKFYKETGTLHFIKFLFENNVDFQSYVNSFKQIYGEPDKGGTYEYWYGTVGGIEAYFATEPSVTYGIISVTRESAPTAAEYGAAETQNSPSNWKADYRDTMSKDEIEELVTQTALDEVMWRLRDKNYELSTSKYKIGSITKVGEYYEVSGTLYLYDKYGSIKDIATFTCNGINIDEDGEAFALGTTEIDYD